MVFGIEPIPVLFQDDELVVVDKPIGISIHNAEDPTNLIQVLERQLADGPRFPRLFPVHRLDKETSGVQIFARDEKAAAKSALEFQTQSVEKKYLGILRGSMTPDEGRWTNPISDKSEGRINPAGLTKDRVSAETRFHVVSRTKFFTECEFDLITGRQHQIRKHSTIHGHALVGDTRYGDKKYNQRMSEMYSHRRMFLHCSSVVLMGRKFLSPRPEAFSLLIT